MIEFWIYSLMESTDNFDDALSKLNRNTLDMITDLACQNFNKKLYGNIWGEI